VGTVFISLSLLITLLSFSSSRLNNKQAAGYVDLFYDKN